MPTPRQAAPDLTLPTLGGGTFNLSQDAPARGTFLVFYRGVHCPVCIRQLTELTGMLDQFADRDVRVVAVTADGEDRAQEMANRIGAPGLTIAYDLPLAQAQDWGLYLSTTRGKTSIGITEPDVFPEPGLFYVQPDQTLYFASIQTMPFARPPLDGILGALDFVAEKNYPARGEYTGAV